MATNWVREALTTGRFQWREADKDFPTRIWYRSAYDGRCWTGFCVNTVAGQYKGWPIEEDEFDAL